MAKQTPHHETHPAEGDLMPRQEPIAEVPLNEVTPAGTPPAFEVVKAVTRPVMKFGVSPEFIRVESPIYKGPVMEKAKFKTPPHLMEVINLRTGEPALVVCAMVFMSELEKAYPNNGYVGHDFQVRKIKTDKDYALWSIIEIKLK